MQFDQKTLIRLGLLGAFLLAGFVQWLRGGPIADAPQPPVTITESAPVSPSPALAPVRAPPVSHGDFDYYVLVLSWSPTYCGGHAGGGDEEQCRSGRPYGFVLHGLWPQNEHGYPQNCESGEPREVSEENLARALAITPSKDLVRHEWEKHGMCSGLSQDDFITTETQAFQSVRVPQTYVEPAQPLSTTPDDVREAFLNANPALSDESVAATCSRNELAEVWVCLDKSLHPRACSAEVRKRHCGARHVHMLAVRRNWR